MWRPSRPPPAPDSAPTAPRLRAGGTELATNLLKHAGGGRIVINLAGRAPAGGVPLRPSVQLPSLDHGPDSVRRSRRGTTPRGPPDARRHPATPARETTAGPPGAPPSQWLNSTSPRSSSASQGSATSDGPVERRAHLIDLGIGRLARAFSALSTTELRQDLDEAAESPLRPLLDDSERDDDVCLLLCHTTLTPLPRPFPDAQTAVRCTHFSHTEPAAPSVVTSPRSGRGPHGVSVEGTRGESGCREDT